MMNDIERHNDLFKTALEYDWAARTADRIKVELQSQKEVQETQDKHKHHPTTKLLSYRQ